MFISVILLPSQLGDGDHPWIPLVLSIFLFIISIALLFILLSSRSFLLLTPNSLTFNLSLPALKTVIALEVRYWNSGVVIYKSLQCIQSVSCT